MSARRRGRRGEEKQAENWIWEGVFTYGRREEDYTTIRNKKRTSKIEQLYITWYNKIVYDTESFIYSEPLREIVASNDSGTVLAAWSSS